MGQYTYYEMYVDDYTTPIVWPEDFKPNQPPKYVNVLKGKVYGVSGQTLYFPNVGEPASWDPAAVDQAGAGFIDLSHELPGYQELVTSQVYQDQLAIFARSTVSLWVVDPDPSLNALSQSLSNVGTIAPRSTVSYGDADLIFLDRSGIRSIRAREGTNLAAVDDVGTPIDEIVTDWIREIGTGWAGQAIGLLEPKDGRYWLIMGSGVFVYTFFPAVRVSAWSTYRFEVNGETLWCEDAVVLNDTIVLRAGDKLYSYGMLGTREKVYDASTVTVETPYLAAEDPASFKRWRAFDMAATGSWAVSIGTQPRAPSQTELIGTFDGVTYNDQALPLSAYGSHLRLTLQSQGSGYHRLNNMAVHYEKVETS